MVTSRKKLGYFFDEFIHKDNLNKNIERTDMAIAVVGSKVILFGGWEKGNFSNKIDIYDLTTNTWTTAIADGEARSSASVAVIGTTAIFFGGFMGLKGGKNTYSKQINVYDDENGSWTVAEASEARGFSISVAVVGSKAVFFGGDKATSSNRKSNDLSKRVDIYDSVDKNWRTHETNKAHAWSAVAVVGTKAIFFGGYDDLFKTSQQIDIYDSSTDSWKYATTPTARTDVAAGVIGKKAVFFGGRTYHGNQIAQFSNAIDVYNDENGDWTTARINNESEARDNASVAVAGNKIIFFGGRIGDNKFSGKIDIYDSSKKGNNWITSTASEAREQVSVAVIEGKAVFFGGRIGDKKYSSKIDIYDSITNKWVQWTWNDVIVQDIGTIIQGNLAVFIAKSTNGDVLKYKYSYPPYSYDVMEGSKNLSLVFTQSVFKSNAANRENSAESLYKSQEVSKLTLLEKFKISLAQQVNNKPGWFIIEGKLNYENINESFLLLPKDYDLSRISEESYYEEYRDKFGFEYQGKVSQKTSLKDITFTFIRLNINGNIRKLRQKAYAGGPKKILTLGSQKMEQLKFSRFQPKDAVPSTSYPPDHLDFNGAYGIYLWEIFFHVPTLIALHLNQEQEFAKARKWYQYILNPTNDNNQTWQFLPFTKHNTESVANALKNTQTIQELEIDPFDPYVIAKQRATAFEKYVIIRYIDNLIDWGDMLFAKKSWEAINQATMLYVRAWDLLGRKPIKQGKLIVEAQTFEKLASNQQSGNLPTLCRLETKLPATGGQSSSPEQSCTRAQSADEVYDMTKYGYYFCKPENKDFIDLWSRVEDCLHKIRHCLDSEGKRLVLPLFQAPIDPRQLIQTYASASSGSAVAIPSVSLPHYRFSYMINYAKSVVETVMQFGSELLGVLEKKRC
ncbi:MAG: kelch repeat-containing protein [Wolbachia sp.]